MQIIIKITLLFLLAVSIQTAPAQTNCAPSTIDLITQTYAVGDTSMALRASLHYADGRMSVFIEGQSPFTFRPVQIVCDNGSYIFVGKQHDVIVKSNSFTLPSETRGSYSQHFLRMNYVDYLKERAIRTQ